MLYCNSQDGLMWSASENMAVHAPTLRECVVQMGVDRVLLGFVSGFLQRLDDVIWVVPSCNWSFLLKQKYVCIQHVRNLLQKKSIPRFSGVNAAERIKLGSQLTKPATRIIDCRWFYFQPTKDMKGCYCSGFVYISLIKIYQDSPHPAIIVHPAITVRVWIWNDGTVIFLDVIKLFRIGISQKKHCEALILLRICLMNSTQLASIEIQFWLIEFLEKPPTSLWPPFFSKPWILKGWSHDF